MSRLIDLGERRILREIIPKWCEAAGDDCASVEVERGHVLITTDPVPPPAAKILGNDPDLFWFGWLLVTINASDLAAAGAVPRAFVAALDLPRETPTTELERLLEGIKCSCEANSITYVGGNLRESDALRGVGTAVGFCDHAPLTRRGAQKGDLVGIFGRLGNFWSDAFRVRAGLEVDKRSSNLFAPISQVGFIHQYARAGLLNCAMDASDGLAPTLEEISNVNNLAIEIDLRAIISRADIFEQAIGARACMGWGDWLVVATFPTSSLGEIESLSAEIGAELCVCGHLTDGAGVFVSSSENRIRLGKLDSERFVSDSWFSAGIETYIDNLKNLKID